MGNIVVTIIKMGCATLTFEISPFYIFDINTVEMPTFKTLTK